MPSSIFYTSFTLTHTSEASLSSTELGRFGPDTTNRGQDILLNAAISLSHDHSGIITLQPLVVSHHTLDTGEQPPVTSFLPPSSSSWQLYSFTESKPILFNLTSSSITCKAWLRKSDHGYDSVVSAPAGVTLEVTWVTEGISDTGDRPEEVKTKGMTSVKLTETAKITCPRVFAGFIRSTFTSAHQEMHERFWGKCKERIVAGKL